MKLVVLDIDGVLNCSTTKDRISYYIGIESKKVALLKDIVDKLDAKIALISTWKYHYYIDPKYKDQQDEFAAYLDEKLNEYDLKISYIIPDYLHLGCRAEYVNYFLEELKKDNITVNYDDIVILDDIDDGYTDDINLKDRYIQTSFEDGGLTEELIRESNCFIRNNTQI